MRSDRFCISVSLLLVCSAGAPACAQDSLQVKKLKYINSFTAGALFGKYDAAITASLLTMHGVGINRFRAGMGLGVEGYDRWRVVPFFASVSYDIARVGQNAVYLQMNAGYALGRKLNKAEGVTSEEERGGLMLNPMLGYRIELEKKYSLHVAIGHKLQRTKYSYEYSWWNHRYTVDEEMNRFYFLIGFGIN